MLTRRITKLVTAAALAAALIGGGWVVGNGHGQRVGERVGAEAALAARDTADAAVPPVVPTARLDDAFCPARTIIEVGGIDYALLYSDHDASLIDTARNPRTADACGPGRGHSAQIFIGYDSETRGCVRYTYVVARPYIVSFGWGLIPGDGRLTPAPAAACLPAWWSGGEAGVQSPVVPPIEDVAGYVVDRDADCGSRGDAVYLPAVRACVPESLLAPGDGNRLRLVSR